MKAFHIAIRNNLQTAIARNNILKAKINLQKEAVSYNIAPSLSLGIDSSKSTSGYPSHSLNLGLGASKKLRMGTEISVDINSKMLLNQASSYYGFDPAYKAGLTISVSQPLLKGAGSKYTEYSRNTYNLELKNSIIQYSFEISKILKDTEVAYWNYYYYLRQLKLKEKYLKHAKELLKMHTAMVRQGVSPQVDLIESKSIVATRNEELIGAINDVAAAKDKLLYILNITKNTFSVPLIRLNTKPLIKQKKYSLSKFVREALKKNFDFYISKNNLKINSYTLLYYSNLMRPDLNLNLSLGINGYNSGFFNSYSEMTKGNNYTLGFDLSLALPISSKSDKYELEKQKLARKNLLLSLVDKRRTIINNVRNSIRNISAASQRINAARKAHELAREKMKVVVKKFNLKLSSNNDVMLAQTQFLDAGLKVEKAVLDYNIAKALLFHHCGNNIELYKIKIK